MARLVWNQPGERFYETGVDRGVLYPISDAGVPWNGLVSVNENSAGGELESHYFDGVKYLDIVLGEDFQATLEAYTAPPEFAACDGTRALAPGLFVTHQPRVPFGLSYRTLKGNDTEGVELGYKLHLVYNATAGPAAKINKTLSSSSDLNPRQWTINTVPQDAISYRPTAHIIVDSTLALPERLTALENFLYGTSTKEPELPSQAFVIGLLS